MYENHWYSTVYRINVDVSKDGRSALIRACVKSNLDSMRCLLENGADVNHADNVLQ